MSTYPLRERPPASDAVAPRSNIVVVSHVPPWPATAGNEYRLARLIAWLEETGYTVHFVFRPFRSTPLSEADARELAARYPRLYVFEPNEPRVTFATDSSAAYDAMSSLATRPVATYEREFVKDQDLLDPRILQLTRDFAPDHLIALVASLADAVNAKAVIAQYIFMSRLLPPLGRRTIRMLDLIDVFSSKHDKVLRFGVDDQFAVSKENEAYLLARADVAIAIQAEEAELVRTLVPNVRVITAGIDYPVVPESRDAVGTRVLMVGSDNPLNKAGLAGFLRYAWPTVLREVPDAELAVVGSVGATLSGGEPGVVLMGRVDDIDDAYASARLAINPSFAGTGVKVKTLEAIAHRRPIVVWPTGADGLAPEVRAACSIADNWSAFAWCVIGHLRRSNSSNGSGHGAERIARALSPDVVYGELLGALKGRRSLLGFRR